MTIGIYGGSFNPIHLGHTKLAQWLVRHGYIDELWFLVSPQNPLKIAADLLDDEARLRLAQLAVGRKKGVKVSDFEFHLPRPSFMVQTLESLRTVYPSLDFVLVIGADNWHRFPHWKDSGEILRHHRLIIYPRPDYPIDPSTLPSDATMVDAPLMDISSTEIRKAIASDTAYDGYGLPRPVWKEIQARRYYFTDV